MMDAIAQPRHTYKSRKSWDSWQLDPTVNASTSSPTVHGPACARCGSTVRLNIPGRPKECVRCKKQWRKENRSKYSKLRKQYRWRNALGLTREQYDQILASQGGVCAICKQPERIKGWAMSVDHCHETGKFRGILCSHCNRGLGFLGDNLDRLEAAADYLRNNRWAL